MREPRVLIVNADDFGLSRGVNAGVAKGHEEGIVTSASFLVRGHAAGEAAAYASTRPDLGLGLHVDLGEWAFREGRWMAEYEVVAIDDEGLVQKEARDQLEAFRRLTGRNPDHLDSHQHVHLHEPVDSALRALSRELGILLRHRTLQVRYCGDFYGQTGEGTPLPEAITPQRLVRLLTGLPPGITELACHPGEGGDMDSAYRTEREAELRSLCDPRVREVIEQEAIELRSFAGLLEVE